MSRRDAPNFETIGLSADDLAFVVLKARAFDVQEGVVDPDEGSNAVDGRALSVLEGQSDDPTRDELRAAIWRLNQDQQEALVALAWIGRGDFEPEDWKEALKLARERQSGPTARYLMGMPQLGDYLEEGAAALGFDLGSAETDLLHPPGGES